MKRYVSVIAVIGCALLITACGGNRFDRAVSGAGVGALGGAGAGALLGPLGVVTGALIGAGAGAGVGVATDESDINLGKPIYR